MGYLKTWTLILQFGYHMDFGAKLNKGVGGGREMGLLESSMKRENGFLAEVGVEGVQNEVHCVWPHEGGAKWEALSQLRAPAASTQYIVAARYSSVILPGPDITSLETGTLIQWSIVLPEGRTSIVIHTLQTDRVRLREFYSNRIAYHVEDGSMELKSADLDDRAIYENAVTTFGAFGNRTYYDKILDVQEILKPPTIVQNPNPAADLVQLHCIEKSGEAQTILWSKDGELLENNATYKLSFDNRTLTVNTEYLQMCQQYTCVIRNKVSENWNTHLLVLE
eukprot:g31916.t1